MLRIGELLGFVGRLNLVQGVENDLRRRRRTAAWALCSAVLLQLIVAALKEDYLDKLGHFFASLVAGRWDAVVAGAQDLNGIQLISALVLIAGVGVWALLRGTRFLIRNSGQPFRYTFSVDPFLCLSKATTEELPGGPLELPPAGRFRLLHHDLMDKISCNIDRLSLLNVAGLPDAGQRDLSSHIHISGHYLVRKDQGSSRIEVMPRVRIGPPERPEQLALRVVLTNIDIADGDPSAGGHAHIVEYVYGRIATAIYEQIRKDIQAKIRLYPTAYLRAAALFYEARDFEQSNTVDGYDHAIELYREALRYFDVRSRRRVLRRLLGTPGLWRILRPSQLLEARVRVAYCRCLVYRQMISALSARTQPPLFGIADELQDAILVLEGLHVAASRRRSIKNAEFEWTSANAFALLSRYLTYPRDTRALQLRPIFEEQREALFEAYAVSSLVCSQLNAIDYARAQLRLARATAPDAAENSPLYLLAAAESIPDFTEKIQLLLKALDLAPNSEILSHRMAHFANMRFRLRNELGLERARPILAAFQKVQRINPGNVSACAARGYIFWLLEDFDQAVAEYREGLAIKTDRQPTFVGTLTYGLARIAAETGRLNDAFDMYAQAMAADPGVGAHLATETHPLNDYYDYITDSMLQRYERFAERVRNFASKNPSSENEGSARVAARIRDGVLSFALNDYANACLQYYVRTGRTDCIARAIAHYKHAALLNAEIAVVYYNLSSALSWTAGATEGIGYLEKADRLAEGWLALLVQSTEANLRQVFNSIRALKTEQAQLENEIASVENQLAQLVLPARDPSSKRAREIATVALVADTRSETRRRTMERDITLRFERIDGIREELQNLRHTLHSKMLPKLDQMLRASSFAPFFEGLGFGNMVPAIQRFLATPLRKDQVDRDFVELLSVWIRLLSQESNEENLLPCVDLCHYILTNFYPAHTGVHLTLLELYSRLKDSTENRRERIDSLWTVRRTIEHSLACDPTRWNYLNWALDFFDLQLCHLRPDLTPILDRPTIESASTAQWIAINDELRQQLSEEGIDLSPHARIRTVELGTEWIISTGDGERAYRLTHNSKGAPIVVTFAGDTTVDVIRTAVNHLDVQDKKKLAVLNSMLAQEYARVGEDSSAVGQYRSAIQNDPENAIYLNALGDYHYRKYRFAEAAAAYERAAGVDSSNDLYVSNLALAEEAQSFLSPHDGSQNWRRAAAALERAAALKPDAADYAKRLEYARQQVRLYEYLGGKPNLPVATPIAIELGGQPLLEEADPDASWDRRFEKLRSSIERDLGVHIPGVFRRRAEDLPNGEYRIFLSELPVAAGTVDVDPDLSPSDPLDGVVQHLDAVLRRRAPEFIGHQEVLNILERQDPVLFEYFTEKADALSRLVWALRALVREGISITVLKRIAQQLKDSPQEEASLHRWLQELRASAAARAVLPGVVGEEWERLSLGKEFLVHFELLHTGDHSKGDGIVTLSVDRQVELVDHISELVKEKTKPAIVVEDEALRPFVRWLLEDTLPAVPVISTREVLAEMISTAVAHGAVQ